MGVILGVISLLPPLLSHIMDKIYGLSLPRTPTTLNVAGGHGDQGPGGAADRAAQGADLFLVVGRNMRCSGSRFFGVVVIP